MTGEGMTTNEDRSGESIPTNPSSRRPPSVWPAFIAFVAAIALMSAVEFVAGMVIGVWYVATGGDSKRLADELPDLLLSPPLFVTLTFGAQLAILTTAIIAGRFASAPRHSGLGFVRPTLPIWGYPILAVGSLLPLAIAGGVAEALSLVTPQDQSLIEQVFGRVPPRAAVLFVLFIAIVPGFIEEAFFRGYIQRRLLARWPAWASVSVAAGLFGLIHGQLAYIAFAFVIGLWLGTVALRTGSVWPAAFCHATINTVAGAWNFGARFHYIPDPPPDVAVIATSVVAIGCFIASVWLLASSGTRKPRSSPDS
jgi:membrane protease YdiL (CAAX protease family)